MADRSGAVGPDPSIGLWVVIARRALAGCGPIPAGGVLLSLTVSCEGGPAQEPGRVTVDVRRHERTTSDGRRFVTVTCDIADNATVTFVLLLPVSGSGPGGHPAGHIDNRDPDVGEPPSTPPSYGPVTTDLAVTTAWSRLTHDANPLHTSETYAAGSRFGVPIVHGHYLAALVGERLDRENGSRPLSFACDFVAPVPVGASIELDIDVTAGNVRGEVRRFGATAVRVTGHTNRYEDSR